jgi:hypothetical protein
VSNKWVLKTKLDGDKKVDKFKSQLIVKNFKQTQDMNFKETYTLNIKQMIIKKW